MKSMSYEKYIENARREAKYIMDRMFQEVGHEVTEEEVSFFLDSDEEEEWGHESAMRSAGYNLVESYSQEYENEVINVFFRDMSVWGCRMLADIFDRHVALMKVPHLNNVTHAGFGAGEPGHISYLCFNCEDKSDGRVFRAFYG